MVLLFMLAHTDGTVKEYDANGFIGSVNINKIPSKLRSGMILHLDNLSLQGDGSDDESLKSESDSDD